MDAPLLRDTVKGAIDYKGSPAIRSETGLWRSAVFIIGVEIAERFSFYGIGSNLITYLTGPLQQSTVTAAVNVNTWSGVGSMLPLLGAFVADAYLGRYRMIVFSSLLYVLGLGLLTLSAVLPFGPPNCHNSNDTTSCHPPQFQIIIFFCSLYLVALAQGGHKPCVQAFGADQFDGGNPEEFKSKSSFFNWWYFGMCGGIALTHLILNYIQDNLSWGLGFGIPCVCMVAALAVFLLGTKTYRFSSFNDDNDNPFGRVARVFVAALRNWRTTPSAATVDEEEGETLLLRGANQFGFLDKALATASEDCKKGWLVCSVDQVEEAKALLRLVPIWATCLVYAMVGSQSSTFFTKQGATMDRRIGSNFQIPPGSLQTFSSLSVVLFIPIYVRVLIPIARALTQKHTGITVLQRIGVGMVVAMMSMVAAALVERERLQTAIDFNIVDIPEATVPMSVWWLAPQYIFIGISNVFTMVGLQEFFYDEMPDGLRSLGLALYLSIMGVGSFLSSFLVSAIEKVTGGDGRDSWFSNNLNRAHLDYFYWLLAGLSVVGLVAYIYFSKSYVYNRACRI